MPDSNALHTAAKAGDLAEVQSQVSNFDVNAKDENDRTALYWAAQEGFADIVKLLLTLNADVNIPDVSTTHEMISVHLICIYPSLTSISYPPFHMYCYHLNPVTQSRYTTFSTTHDIQYYFL